MRIWVFIKFKEFSIQTNCSRFNNCASVLLSNCSWYFFFFKAKRAPRLLFLSNASLATWFSFSATNWSFLINQFINLITVKKKKDTGLTVDLLPFSDIALAYHVEAWDQV